MGNIRQLRAIRVRRYINEIRWENKAVNKFRFHSIGAMLSIYGMDREKLKCSEMYCHFRSPKKFLEEMSMDTSTYWIDAVSLIAIFIVLRVIAYFVLRWKVHSIR